MFCDAVYRAVCIDAGAESSAALFAGRRNQRRVKHRSLIYGLFLFMDYSYKAASAEYGRRYYRAV